MSGEKLAITLIVIGAFALRLVGINRGLPYLHEWDEPDVLNVVVRMVLHGSFDPHDFTYTALFRYMLSAVVRLHYFYLHSTGAMASLWDIRISHPQAQWYGWYWNYPSFFVWARFLTVLLSSATVYLVYRIGTVVYDAAAGLLAAALLAVAPGAIYYSDSARVDTPMVFFVAAAVLAGLAIPQRGRWTDYALAGLLGGLAISTKQNALLVVLPLGMAHLVNTHRRSLFDGRLAVVAVCLFLGFAIGSPYFLIHWRDALVMQRMLPHNYAGASNGLPNLISMKAMSMPLVQYLHYFVRPSQGAEWYVIPHVGIGLLPVLAATAGLITGFFMNPRLHLYLLSFPLPYFVFFLGFQVYFLRSMLPVLPFIALFAGALSVWAWRRIQTYSDQAAGRRALPYAVAAALGVALLLAGPAHDSFGLAWAMRQEGDTRNEAVEWLQHHARPGDRVALEEDLYWFLPALNHAAFTVLFSPQDASREWYSRERADFAVVGEASPLRTLPAVTVFSPPPYLPTMFSPSPYQTGLGAIATWQPRSYPLISPKIFVIRLQP